MERPATDAPRKRTIFELLWAHDPVPDWIRELAQFPLPTDDKPPL
jgi:hypothetical protein